MAAGLRSGCVDTFFPWFFWVGFWQNGVFADFYFWAARSSRGFCRLNFFFVGKGAQKNPQGKSPAKSSKIYTTKIPDTSLQKGPGQGFLGIHAPLTLVFLPGDKLSPEAPVTKIRVSAPAPCGSLLLSRELPFGPGLAFGSLGWAALAGGGWMGEGGRNCFLRFSAVSCGSPQLSAAPNRLPCRSRTKSAKICENLRQAAVSPFQSLPFSAALT